MVVGCGWLCAVVLGAAAAQTGRAADEDAQATGASFHSRKLTAFTASCSSSSGGGNSITQHNGRLPGLAAGHCQMAQAGYSHPGLWNNDSRRRWPYNIFLSVSKQWCGLRPSVLGQDLHLYSCTCLYLLMTAEKFVEF